MNICGVYGRDGTREREDGTKKRLKGKKKWKAKTKKEKQNNVGRMKIRLVSRYIGLCARGKT